MRILLSPLTWLETFSFGGFESLYHAMEEYSSHVRSQLDRQIRWPLAWSAEVLESSLTTKPSIKIEIYDGDRFAGFPVTTKPYPRSPYHYFTLAEPEEVVKEVIGRLYVKNGGKWVKFSSITSGKIEAKPPRGDW